MHDHHSHHHNHHHDHTEDNGDMKKLAAMLDHWIDHIDSHAESYEAWAAKAGEHGEHEIAREIHLAVLDGESIKAHLKRAKAILAAKLVLKK